MNITIGKPWAVSEKGGRLNNEDSIYPLPEAAKSNQKLFLVCDGVGGAEKERSPVRWPVILSKLSFQPSGKVSQALISLIKQFAIQKHALTTIPQFIRKPKGWQPL